MQLFFIVLFIKEKYFRLKFNCYLFAKAVKCDLAQFHFNVTNSCKYFVSDAVFDFRSLTF